MPKYSQNKKIIRSSIFNPINTDLFNYYSDGALLIDNTNKIIKIGNFIDIVNQFPDVEIINKINFFMLPGLIDTHTHLPQFEAKSCGEGELLEWLNNYIFPLEEKFANSEFAREKSKQFFYELLKNGTTTVAVYTANIMSATDIAFEEAASSGIRAFIGNSLMDFGGNTSLHKSFEENVNIIKKMKEKWHNHDNRLFYILTPRFAGSTSRELMKFCSKFAYDNDLLIQTHLAENKHEVEFMLSLYSESNSYTEIYHTLGLLNNGALLAHGIYLTDEELTIIKESNSFICHCPSSNRFLESGIMPLSLYLNNEINVALGTDVAGGYSLSMFNEAKEAKEMAKLLKVFDENRNHRNINISEVFYLSTLAGAKALKIDKNTGNFSANKFVDYVLINKNNIPDKKVFKSPNDILSEIYYSISQVDETVINGTTVYKA